MNIIIRKWGNSAGAIFPAVALAKAGVSLGDELELEVQEGQITLKQKSPKYSLDALLKESPPDAFALNQENEQWLHDGDMGKEAV